MTRYRYLFLIMLGPWLTFSQETALAQKARVTKKESGRTVTPSVTPVRAGVIMRNGQLMQVRGKEFSPILRERSFPNGSKVLPNGQLTTATGEVIQLQNGDHLDLQGNLTPNPVELQQSTTLTGDSTGLGQPFLKAQQQQERLLLLQRKVALLEKKNELLQRTVKGNKDTEALEKLDAEIARVQQLITEDERKE